ncbi:MAG: histidine ammonia-lyase [Chitinivibrionales bacterium]|nr:histidine ammonia-lyase [Chitinivibrionales bacterium]
MEPVIVSGKGLTIHEVVAVADGRSVALNSACIPAIERSRRAVEDIVAQEKIVYGVTTGFGRFKDKFISADQAHQLQLNLVRSHAVGVGPYLEERVVRAMLLVRANTLALGYSGVRLCVIQLLLDMLNAQVHPRLPCQGSLGASGDLAPLAHLALCLIGEGEASYKGKILGGREALTAAGLQPLVLQTKEGLALLNGTAMMVGLGALLTDRAVNLTHVSDIAGCLSLEALNGTDRAFDSKVHAVRPHPRQIDCAAYLRSLLADSKLVRSRDSMNVQDAYTLRCIPQVHGAVRDSVAYAEWVINIELNSVNDNPLIFIDEKSQAVDVISAGNFHGEPIALAMDYLKLGITELGNMCERRIARLVDADSNGGVLPMFLAHSGGLESGMMIAHYTAASLASENKVFAHPASADSIPTSANTEDHVSMGATATRHCGQVLQHSETIVAIELLCALQGIEYRLRTMNLTPEDLGKGTRKAYQFLRKSIPFFETDIYFNPYIETIREMIVSGKLRLAVDG